MALDVLDRLAVAVTMWRRCDTPGGAPYTLCWANRSAVETDLAGLAPTNRLAPQLAQLATLEPFDREAPLGIVRAENGRDYALRGLVIDDVLVLLAEDITEVRETRGALERTAAELADLYDEAPVGHHSLDEHGVLVRINDTALRWLGYTREDLVGKARFSDLLTDPSQRVFANEFPELIRVGALRDVELDLVCKDGTILPVEIRSTAVRDAEGRFVKSRSTMVDIRARRAAEAALVQALQHIEERAEEGTAELTATSERLARAEEQFRQAQKMEAVGRLAGGIAHDFNNMLQVMLGFTQLVHDDLAPDDPRRDDLGHALAAATRASLITRQLLTFGRQHPTKLEPVDVNAIIVDLDKMIRHLIGPDVQLVMRFGDVHRVRADRRHLEQLIFNLSANARDAMPEGGTLSIETETVELDREYTEPRYGVAPGRYVLIAVSDTGVGMSKEVQEHVFEPFFTTKEAGKGTGLGLSMVYGVVRQWGGHVGCYSEEGRGTTMKVYLPELSSPMDPDAVSDAMITASPSLPPLRGRVLLVEDEELVRAALTAFLRRTGLTVVAPTSGTEAFELATSEQRFDLIVTDVVMPDTSGPDLVQRIMAIAPDTPVLFVSGYADLASMRQGVPEGAAFLQKPVSAAALERKVRELLSTVARFQR